MLSAGQRSHRVRFERRFEGEKSPTGTVEYDWTPHTPAWAAFRPKFGREQVETGQLSAGLIGTLTVLSSTKTAEVTEADRVVFVTGPYKGRVCQIRSVVPTPDGREIEFLLESGVET